jgi:hypothetical protein
VHTARQGNVRILERSSKVKKWPGISVINESRCRAKKILSTDDDRGLILIHGAVPGAKNGWVTIKDAVKKVMPDDLPFPVGLRAAKEEKAPTTEEATPGSPEGEEKD